jgi:hypothetical protein
MSDVVNLDQVRAFLRFADSFTTDDDILSTLFIPTATDVINRECDFVTPQTFDEYYDGGDYSIWLRHTPVLSVQLVSEGWGFTDYSLEEIQVNSESMPTMFAFSIDMPESGKISRRSGGNVNIPFIRGEGNVHVIYKAGREDIPAGIATVALELIQIWYRAFLQDQATADPDARLEDQYDSSRSGGTGPMSGAWFGVPAYLIELLKPYKRGPIIG